MDQHQAMKDLTGRLLLSCVDDPAVFGTCCRQTEKVTNLCKDDASFFFCPSQMFFIRCAQGSCFRDSQYIHTSSAQLRYDGF